MAIREFPGLGFDPAPGDPSALSTAATSARTAAGVFGSSAETLSALNSSSWTGQAADGFRTQLRDLPRDLTAAHDAHATTATALDTYGAELAAQQRRATELESRAVELRAQQQAAVAAVNQIAGQQAPTGSAQLDQLKQQYQTARHHADQIGSDLDDVLRAARGLRDAHHAAAATAARAIRGATKAPYQEPNWFSRQWNKVTNWISDHADTLKSISDALKIVSGVLGLLSLIPGLQWLAPIAMAAAGIALGIDITLKLVTGKGSWTSIGIDAALTFLPAGKILGAGGKLLKTLRGVDEAADLAVGADRAITTADQVVSEADDLGHDAFRIFREDSDFASDVNSVGIRKSHLDADGNLHPANPDGTTTPLEHVQGGLDVGKKSNSPWTSFKTGTKVYGDSQVAVDVNRLEADVAAGRLPDVEVVNPDRLQAVIQSKIDTVAGKSIDVPADLQVSDVKDFLRDQGLSSAARGKLSPVLRALINTRRDGEWLIKGVIPKEYITGPYPVSNP